jgi:hypothetical protein
MSGLSITARINRVFECRSTCGTAAAGILIQIKFKTTDAQHPARLQ